MALKIIKWAAFFITPLLPSTCNPSPAIDRDNFAAVSLTETPCSATIHLLDGKSCKDNRKETDEIILLQTCQSQEL